MKRFGFTLQKSLNDSYEQDSKAVNQCLKKNYPKIKKKAKKEKAERQWVNEFGLRLNCNYIRGYVPKDKTPVVKTTGKNLV